MTNHTSLTEPFYEAVLKRLVSFGYELKEEDAWTVSYSIQTVENRIRNSCNIYIIPDGLFNVAVDMVCGEFLLFKKQTGTLELANLALDGAITQIHEGDVTVAFASGMSDEEKFNQFVNYLLHNGEGDLVCYRRLNW
ncbi:MAG: hypothetical protein IKW21_06115 [Lachnospiraceae bacterium]|nr:hypothetical protein [Lachnospiraceae bacterium]